MNLVITRNALSNTKIRVVNDLAEGYEDLTRKLMDAVINKKTEVIAALLDDLRRLVPEEDVPEEDQDIIIRAKALIEIGSSDKKRINGEIVNFYSSVLY